MLYNTHRPARSRPRTAWSFNPLAEGADPGKVRIPLNSPEAWALLKELVTGQRAETIEPPQ